MEKKDRCDRQCERRSEGSEDHPAPDSDRDRGEADVRDQSVRRSEICAKIAAPIPETFWISETWPKGPFLLR